MTLVDMQNFQLLQILPDALPVRSTRVRFSEFFLEERKNLLRNVESLLCFRFIIQGDREMKVYYKKYRGH